MQGMVRSEPPALAEYGWTFYEKCRCSGILKYKYRNPDHDGLELEWFVKYYQFRITYNGRQTKVPVTKIEDLDKILKAL